MRLELDPLYVDVIIRRYEAATGQAAILADTGEPFAIVAAEGATKKFEMISGADVVVGCSRTGRRLNTSSLSQWLYQRLEVGYWPRACGESDGHPIPLELVPKEIFSDSEVAG